jgi:hypothetical protein
MARHRERVAARRAAEDHAEYESELAVWMDRKEELETCLEGARNGGTREGVQLILKKGEQAFLVAPGCALIEPRRLPGQWVGRSQGVSLHIAKGVNYRVGGSRGTYQQGAEVPTPIDTGVATLTNQRAVFQGSKQAREWSWSKLLGFQHDDKTPTTFFQVSNRQKVSGLLYDHQHAEAFRLRLAVALAWAEGDTSSVISQLEARLAEHETHRPADPAPTGG